MRRRYSSTNLNIYKLLLARYYVLRSNLISRVQSERKIRWNSIAINDTIIRTVPSLSLYLSFYTSMEKNVAFRKLTKIVSKQHLFTQKLSGKFTWNEHRSVDNHRRFNRCQIVNRKLSYLSMGRLISNLVEFNRRYARHQLKTSCLIPSVATNTFTGQREMS